MIGRVAAGWVSILAFVASCGTTETHRVVTGRPGGAYGGEVAVHMHGTSPPPYEEVAILQAVGSASHADLAHVVEGLKKEAAALGCNALVNVKVDQGAGRASGTALCARIPPTHPLAPPAAAPAGPPPSPPSTCPDRGVENGAACATPDQKCRTTGPPPNCAAPPSPPDCFCDGRQWACPAVSCPPPAE